MPLGNTGGAVRTSKMGIPMPMNNFDRRRGIALIKKINKNIYIYIIKQTLYNHIQQIQIKLKLTLYRSKEINLKTFTMKTRSHEIFERVGRMMGSRALDNGVGRINQVNGVQTV